MNARIFNRNDLSHPADGFYQIEAYGDHPNRNAGVIQVIDKEAGDRMADDFNSRGAGTLRHGDMMLVDHDHLSDFPDQETRAYGWLQELQARDDGLYGRIRWTRTGQQAVDGGDYRFFSTEYDLDDCEQLPDSNGSRIRPVRLGGLTLTNMNNNLGQKPITNRGETQPLDVPISARRAAADEISRLAIQLQAEEKCSLHSAFSRVLNREISLAGIVDGKTITPFARSNREPAEIVSPCEFAVAEVFKQMRDLHHIPSSARYMTIKNRSPRLVAIAENRNAKWDALSDLEPIAHAAYMKACDAGDLSVLLDGIPEEDSDFEARLDFLNEIKAHVLGSPSLGAQGRWDAVKNAPEPYISVKFWKFVLSFSQEADQARKERSNWRDTVRQVADKNRHSGITMTASAAKTQSELNEPRGRQKKFSLVGERLA